MRRTALPAPGVSVKIAAIEHRSEFMQARNVGDYLGIELGADASAGIDLDDYMVFDNDSERATEFFQGLVFRHARAIAESQGYGDTVPKDKKELFRQAFTDKRAMEEFVRASEGVPRDAINILALAAQYALDRAISVSDVRKAAHNWYQRDKQKAVSANRDASKLLQYIVGEVIGNRRARAFLLPADQESAIIIALHGARVIHILKRSISSPSGPGERYRVYKLDYGCYVDLVSTDRAPIGLLPFDDGGGEKFVDVPPDDYRSIRRAILSLKHFAPK